MSINKKLTLPCGTILPNRLAKAAMTEALADDYGRPTGMLCTLYKVWSEGGCGLLITGNVQVDRRYVERPGNVCIDGEQTPEHLEMLRLFAKAAQTSGSKVFAQISHAGRQSNGMINMSPVGPGSVRINLPKVTFGTPRPLSVDEIHEVQQRFVHAAVTCRDCGFDGVQIHSAHGYLLSSFLNPNANNRESLFGSDDPYGGPLENRARLLLDTVRAIRKEVGPSFAISVKLNSADFQEGGFTAEEAVRVSQMLERESIDLLEISGGNYEAGIYEETVTNAEEDERKESTKRREAYFLEYAVEVTKALKKVPVMVTGGWRTRASMEDAVSRGDCAMIGLGRPLCGAPHSPRGLLDGSLDELPRYEKELRMFHWSMRWVLMVPLKIMTIVAMVAHQSWFYRNIACIAETGKPNADAGVFSSMIANLRHEKNLASSMKGDVECTGSIYKGKASQPSE